MKIALRNFLTTLRRYKASSLLNIIGLTLAFTACYIILVQVRWEMTYNRTLRDSERIYLIETTDWYEPGAWQSWINRPLSERLISSTSAIEAGGCSWSGFGPTVVLRENASKMGYDRFNTYSGFISLSLLDVFDFQPVAGDVHDLKRAQSVIISRSTAEQLGVGIGDMIWCDTEQPSAENAYEVVAVFEDFPQNSLLADCKMAMDLGDRSLDEPSEWSYNYFVRLQPGTDPGAVADGWEKFFIEMNPGEANEEGHLDTDPVRLSCIRDLYFESDSRVPCAQGSLVTTYTLLGIALLVIALAFINFVNFFFALVPVRIRTVNTFKVFGAPNSSLRFGFVFEAVGLVVIALLLAWYLSFAIQSTELASYISAPLNLAQNLPVIGILLAVAVVMALVASLYPAWYITSFPPAMVVKGAFSGTAGGRRLRTLLLGFQFTISMGLIIATGFILLQHNFMLRQEMGFDRRNMMAVQLSEKAALGYDALRNRLLADPRVVDVTGAEGRLVSANRMSWGRRYKDEPIILQAYIVRWNFLKMMGITITDGRDFLESDEHKETGMLICNEAARNEYKLELGDEIGGFCGNDPLVGVCADFHFRPMQYNVVPFVFYVIPEEMSHKNGGRASQLLYLRYRPEADVEGVADYLRQCIAETDPHLTPGEIQIRTFEEELGQEYAKERRLATVVGLFTLLSVVIALMGVFGIVLFETQHRRREVAVRKVMGATTGEILRLFNRHYIRLVVVSFVIAAPLSLWIVHRWLASFAYRTPIHWWVFAAAFAAVLLVTIGTVTFCSWRTADENPADSVKSE
ncbi:efflux ABC transporter permease protein [Alistipes sp. CAG:268]|jgi:putative ABC transport system permease protein|uniref:ABC transporter permease n=1 Tax=Alistipes sp. CAG:268 TaxID=1262693 RepID=UPI000338EAE2|nr:ABC transporter permease [Alistipes sp. CAG:268]CDC97412.1 efflux ABC transporter permease protein [Alistipes sp. CAG:268]